MILCLSNNLTIYGEINLMKKIKSSTLKIGEYYFYTLYSDKENYVKAKLVSRPTCQIGLMEDDDRFVFQKENEEYIEFRRNKAYPHYLVTDIPGKKQNSFIMDRVKFHIEGD